MTSLGRKMAHYKTLVHTLEDYKQIFILCVAQCDRAVVNFFTSVRDRGR